MVLRSTNQTGAGAPINRQLHILLSSDLVYHLPILLVANAKSAIHPRHLPTLHIFPSAMSVRVTHTSLAYTHYIISNNDDKNSSRFSRSSAPTRVVTLFSFLQLLSSYLSNRYGDAFHRVPRWCKEFQTHCNIDPTIVEHYPAEITKN